MSKSVLIIENSKQEWEFFRDIFDLRGDKAQWVQDPSKAEDTFLAGKYDLVIIEALLPKVSGYEICKKIKNYDKGKNSNVILTGAILSSAKFAHQAKTKFLADDIIIQPFIINDIEKKLSRYLDGVTIEDNKEDLVSRLGSDKDLNLPVDFSKARLAIPFSGSLDIVPFPRVIAYFSLLGEDGTLNLAEGKISKSILFTKGKPVGVLGLIRHERLGQLLLEKGKINEDIFEKAINAALESKKRIGEVLLEMQAISPHELYQAIIDQAEKKILEIFSWEAGDYNFIPDLHKDENDLGININIPTLILKGVTLHWGISALEEEFKDFTEMTVYPVAANFENIQAQWNNPNVKKVLGKINGKRTFNQIISASNMEENEAMRILFTLMILEVAVLAPARESVKKDSSRIFMKLGPRLIFDNTEKGAKYKEHIEEIFYSIIEKSSRDIFNVQGDVIDSEAITEIYNNHIASLNENSELFEKADELTRSRIRQIKDKLSFAKDTIFKNKTSEDESERKTSVTTFFPPQTTLLESEKEFRKGVSAFEMDDYKTAKDHFKIASALDGDTAEYLAYFGYSTYITADSLEEKHKGLEEIQKSIEVNPNLDQPYLFLGNIYRDKEEIDKAEINYQNAFEHNPRSLSALKELRKIYLNKKLMHAGVVKSKSHDKMEFEHMINSLYKEMKNMNFFDLLGATQETSHDDLRKKYFELSAKYRPTEALKMMDEVIQERAEEVFQRLTDAYSTLIDTENRSDYIDTLKSSQEQGQEIRPDGEESEEAAALFSLGKQAMQKKEFKNASLHFRRAFIADPFEEKYQAYMAYAIYEAFKDKEKSHEAALIKSKEVIRNSIIRFPDCDTCYFLMAQIYYEEGKKLLADEQIENALRINPDNIEALGLYYKIYAKPRIITRAKYLNENATKIEFIVDQAKESYSDLKKMNYFQILDIPKGSDVDAVNEAYDNKISTYKSQLKHPNIPTDLKAIIYEIITLIQNAHTALKDTQSQENYIKKLDRNEFESRFDISGLTDHRQIYKIAKLMLKEGMFKRAIKAFKKAVKLSPAYPIYQIWHGFAIFKENPDDPIARDVAKEIIDKALDIDETNADAYWMMGKIFLFEGNEAQAMALFKKALEINPKHKEAGLAISLKDQRARQRRKVQSKTLSDTIRGWFGKK